MRLFVNFEESLTHLEEKKCFLASFFKSVRCVKEEIHSAG